MTAKDEAEGRLLCRAVDLCVVLVRQGLNEGLRSDGGSTTWTAPSLCALRTCEPSLLTANL